MRTSLFTSEFSIYKITKEENLYIAIPQVFARLVRQYVMEYQSLLSVPPDKKVKGIMFTDLNAYQCNVETSQKITDVSINQLDFDSNDTLC